MPSIRHTCRICGRKKVEQKMFKYRSHWACLTCVSSADPGSIIPLAQRNDPGHKLRILNLYAGLGGNRRYWQNVEVTAVEKNIKIAAAYKELYPDDVLIVGDAHEYLLKNYHLFDAIWSSPPCQSHTRMNLSFKRERRTYFDMKLYQEIILLRHFFKGLFIIENVIAYYKPLIQPDYKIGRHCFWSNFPISQYHVQQPKNFIESQDKQLFMDWLDIHYEKNLYSTGKDYMQVFRNCVHPKIGLSILTDMIKQLQQ